MQTVWHDILALLGRLLIAVIFVYGGIEKIMGYTQVAQFMSAHHVSGYLLPFVIALEFGGGLALVFGVLTRLVAAALAIFSVAAIALFLLPPGEHLTLVLAELAMIGGLVSYIAYGAGGFSIDRILFKKRRA